MCYKLNGFDNTQIRENVYLFFRGLNIHAIHTHSWKREALVLARDMGWVCYWFFRISRYTIVYIACYVYNTSTYILLFSGIFRGSKLARASHREGGHTKNTELVKIFHPNLISIQHNDGVCMFLSNPKANIIVYIVHFCCILLLPSRRSILGIRVFFWRAAPLLRSFLGDEMCYFVGVKWHHTYILYTKGIQWLCNGAACDQATMCGELYKIDKSSFISGADHHFYLPQHSLPMTWLFLFSFICPRRVSFDNLRLFLLFKFLRLSYGILEIEIIVGCSFANSTN